MNEKTCFNVRETAKYIGLGITKTQQFIRSGIIPSVKLGRRYVIPKEALDKWLLRQSGVEYKEG